MLPNLVLHPVRTAPHYQYTSWLRHGAVQAARAGLLQGEDGKHRGGQLISLSRSLIAERAALRPDHAAAVALPAASELSPNDWLLNSLCQFDVWWCVIAQTATPLDVSHGGVFNPSSAALHQYRSQPAIDTIALDPSARSTAFPGASEDQVAAALAKVLATAESQSHQYGGWWEGPSDNPRVAAWLSEHIK